MPFRLLKHLERFESPSPALFWLSVDSCSVPSLFVCFNSPALPLHISPSSVPVLLFTSFHPSLLLPRPGVLPISVLIISSVIHTCFTSVMHSHVWSSSKGLMRGCPWASHAQARASAVSPQVDLPIGFQAVPASKPLRYVSGLLAPRDSSRSLGFLRFVSEATAGSTACLAFGL